MNSDESASGRSPQIRPLSDPQAVPVFNLIVYVRREPQGVSVRAANLPDLQASAASEPLALKGVIEAAKRRLAEWHTRGESIPWVTPVSRQEADEVERLVAVHL